MAALATWHERHEVVAELMKDIRALPAPYRRKLLSTLAAAGVHGGASYDGLVALEAHAHGLTLFTLDQRARDTYARLGIKYHAI